METTTQIVGKPGVQTSEFWLASAVTALDTLLTVKGHAWGIPDAVLAALLGSTGLIATGYALARSALKRGTHNALASVLSAAELRHPGRAGPHPHRRAADRVTTFVPLALAVVLLTDSLQRFAPWELPRLLVRAVTILAALLGAVVWARPQWPFTGLAAAGLAVVIPAAISALAEREAVVTRVGLR
jgi:hypothetical protein